MQSLSPVANRPGPVPASPDVEHLRRSIIARELRLHPVAPVAAPVPAADHDHLVIRVFRLTALTYLTLGGLIAALWLVDRLTPVPSLAVPGAHVTFALIAAVLHGAGAALYALPRLERGRIWSPALAWLHWGLTNTGLLYPAWVFHAGAGGRGDRVDTLVVMGALLLAGLAAGVVNFALSMLQAADLRRAGGR